MMSSTGETDLGILVFPIIKIEVPLASTGKWRGKNTTAGHQPAERDSPRCSRGRWETSPSGVSCDTAGQTRSSAWCAYKFEHASSAQVYTSETLEAHLALDFRLKSLIFGFECRRLLETVAYHTEVCRV